MKATFVKNTFVAITTLAFMMLLQGCGTIITHADSSVPYDYDHGCFRGTTYDLHWFAGNTTWINNAADFSYPSADDWTATILIGFPVMTCDLALSLVTDVVFLPYDGIKVWVDAPPKPEARLEDSETFKKPLEQK